jgi:hypothetical protein
VAICCIGAEKLAATASTASSALKVVAYAASKMAKMEDLRIQTFLKRL